MDTNGAPSYYTNGLGLQRALNLRFNDDITLADDSAITLKASLVTANKYHDNRAASYPNGDNDTNKQYVYDVISLLDYIEGRMLTTTTYTSAISGDAWPANVTTYPTFENGVTVNKSTVSTARELLDYLKSSKISIGASGYTTGDNIKVDIANAARPDKFIVTYNLPQISGAMYVNHFPNSIKYFTCNVDVTIPGYTVTEVLHGEVGGYSPHRSTGMELIFRRKNKTTGTTYTDVRCGGWAYHTDWVADNTWGTAVIAPRSVLDTKQLDGTDSSTVLDDFFVFNMYQWAYDGDSGSFTVYMRGNVTVQYEKIRIKTAVVDLTPAIPAYTHTDNQTEVTTTKTAVNNAMLQLGLI